MKQKLQIMIVAICALIFSAPATLVAKNYEATTQVKTIEINDGTLRKPAKVTLSDSGRVINLQINLDSLETAQPDDSLASATINHRHNDGVTHKYNETNWWTKAMLWAFLFLAFILIPFLSISLRYRTKQGNLRLFEYLVNTNQLTTENVKELILNNRARPPFEKLLIFASKVMAIIGGICFLDRNYIGGFGCVGFIVVAIVVLVTYEKFTKNK